MSDRALRTVWDKLNAHRSYLWLAVASRGISMAALYVCAARFAPEEFGGFSYAVATGAMLAALCGLSIEVSLNAISARVNSPPRAIFIAGSLQVISSITIAALLCWILSRIDVFAPMLKGRQHLIVWVSANTLLLAMLNAILFSRGSKTWVAAGWCVSSAAFAAAVLVAPRTWSSTELLISYSIAQAGVIVLLLIGVAPEVLKSDREKFKPALGLFRQIVEFGSKQVLSTSLMTIALWLLQTSIMGSFGPGELANYTLALQVYNAIIFLPAILGPPLLSRLAKLEPMMAIVLARKTWLQFCAFSVLLSGVVFAAAMVALQFLPAHYVDARKPIAFACVAAAIHFAKAPLSIYFQAALKTNPDVRGTFLGTAIVLIALMTVQVDASGGQVLRALAHAAQFGTVAVMFHRAALSRLSTGWK